MSQVQKRTRRVREFAGSVWPGMAAGGYANLIAARLRKLASAGSTGMLPVSGPGNGAIYFRDGLVTYAESSRTPTPARRAARLAALGLAATGSEVPAGCMPVGTVPVETVPVETVPVETVPVETVPISTELAIMPSLGKLADVLALAEPTIDAVTELLSNESRYAKFRQWDAPPAARACAMPVGQLLAEVSRRHHVLRQLAVVITADTRIIRAGALGTPRLQVSPPQWALVVRTGTGSTPRALALELGRSVFSTTIEVYRLLFLGLLAVPGQPSPADGGLFTGTVPQPGEIMSFIHAVSDERGSDA